MKHNFQLHKTDVMLGGQMEWNLSVKSIGDNLAVTDFHLTPISRWVDYNKYSQEDLLNYQHKDNIRDLYTKISGQFFDTAVNPRLKVSYPFITEDKTKLDTYCDIYDEGLSRAQYKIYGKQFQLFCPLWLEDFNESSELKFTISIFNRSKEVIASKDLILTTNGEDYHDKFISYFQDYVQYIRRDNDVIGSDLVKCDIKKDSMSISGFDVSTGTVRVKDVSLRLRNLYSRFRPLMEDDGLILACFSENNMVARQLFNFNIMFNLRDILDTTISSMIYGSKLGFKIEAYVDDTKLDCKYFNTDYTSSYSLGNPEGVYALDHLKDYNCIDLIDQNKLCPVTFHWSLVDNDDYIFNFYYNLMPSTNIWAETEKDIESDPSCTHWCKGTWMSSQTFSTLNDILDNIISNLKLSSSFTTFKNSEDNLFIDNNRYTQVMGQEDPLSLYLANVENLNDADWNRLINEVRQRDKNYKTYYTGEKQVLIYKYGSMMYIIFSRSNFYLSYINFKEKLLSEIDIDDFSTFASEFSDNNISNPVVVPVSKSLKQNRSDSPMINTTETYYEKVDIPEILLFRYDGNIRPNFSDTTYNYQIKKISQTEYDKDYDSYVGTGYKPLYPSQDYFYIDSITDNEYDREYHWFNDSSFYILKPEISTTVTVDQKTNPTTIKQIVLDVLSKMYSVEDEELNYIFNLYEYSSDYEYTSNTDIYNYTYTIKLTLL